MEYEQTMTLDKKSVDENINNLVDEITSLRRDGTLRIEALKNEIANYRRNKQIDKETKEALIHRDSELIKEAKQVENNNKAEVSQKVKQANSYLDQTYKNLIKEKTLEIKNKKLDAKKVYVEEIAKAKEEKIYSIAIENNDFGKIEQTKENKLNHNSKLKEIKKLYKQNVVEAKIRYKDKIDKLNDELHIYYLSKYDYKDAIFNKKIPLIDKMFKKVENYKYNFNITNFLLNNGLYVVIILLIIFAIIFYAAKNNQFLFSLDTILLILNQVSPRMFFALGVAGLIVLAGTDLSIGRMVGMGGILTCMLVTTSGKTDLPFFGTTPDFSAMPLGGRVVLGFVLSVVACTAMSSFSGFFSAKFKMHPFVSTLATQLIIFGFFAYATGNLYTGNPDAGVKNAIAGSIGGVFPVMIIWAIIAIVVMWFIWNKTTFGKNIFAVGGNPEAASVSGINVFWVTMGVFILAGIYYGLGASIFGIYTGNIRVGTPQGMENDAIAACVVGGVSFSGGVGKISGVVIGALLFQAITVVMQFLGVDDSNFQLFFKGLIIIAAVALDCAKYLKKK